jgi:hypothetical protein
MNNKFLLPTLAAVAATTLATSAQNVPSPTEDRRVQAATTGEDVGISARDGITVSGADVMVTRNGRTEKLEAPLKLDGGTIINPDGSVRFADGRKVTLRAEQRLTFDGRLLESPVQPNPPPIPAVPATAAPGNTSTGVVGAAGVAGQAGAGSSPGRIQRDNVTGGVYFDNTGVGTNGVAVVDPLNGQPVNVIVDPRTGARSMTFIDPATGRRITATMTANGQTTYRDSETGKAYTANTTDPRTGQPIFTDPRTGTTMTVTIDPRTGQAVYTNAATGAPLTRPTTTNGATGTSTGTTGTSGTTTTGTVGTTTTGTATGKTGATSGTGTTTRSTGTSGTRSGTSGATGTSGGGAGSPGTSGGTPQ